MTYASANMECLRIAAIRVRLMTKNLRQTIKWKKKTCHLRLNLT